MHADLGMMRLASSPQDDLRISLLGLMILVLAFGSSLGWIVHHAQVQRDSVAEIERTGGSLKYQTADPHSNRTW
jgi:hypothetical protein